MLLEGVLLRWDGGFPLIMYPRVGLASSPAPARACFTTRSTMRVSAEDTESSDLHVHAGYLNLWVFPYLHVRAGVFALGCEYLYYLITVALALPTFHIFILIDSCCFPTTR